MNKAALFSISDLGYSYGDDSALYISELNIPEGDTTVFLGSNGSGKTTLLKLMNGLLNPVSGTIRYRGMNLAENGLENLRRTCTYLHQKPYLFRGTVRSNIEMVLKLKGIGKSSLRARTSRYLERLGLTDLQHRNVAQLSGGEQKRTALARTLASDAAVILLDEPTAGIDSVYLDEVETLLLELRESGRTAIISTHHIGFAYRTGDNLVHLDAGTPTAARENLFKGTLSDRDDYFCYFRTGGLTLKCPAREGIFTRAVIPVHDVILSKNTMASSALNQYKGKIRNIGHSEATALITVECTSVLIRAVITDYSAKNLDLKTGDEIYAVFKAAAIQLY